MDLLRVATAGSVDDGKSTLIGRLLLDTGSVLDDQLAEARRASTQAGLAELDLSLLTDGLRAEREQGITIDVAHRYFATDQRLFVLADAPGHVQYTRNMVTAASGADVAVLLTDVVAGLTEQSRRHLAVIARMRVPRVVICVNKMDLVDFAEEPFLLLCQELLAACGELGLDGFDLVPLSARCGDNVVARSDRMPWYPGPSLLECLELAEPARGGGASGARLPVQLVLREQGAGGVERWCAGQLLGGGLAVGDRLLVLPGRIETTVRAIRDADGETDAAPEGAAVSIALADQVDVSRGGMLAAVATAPRPSTLLRAEVCWLAEQPLRPGAVYALRHTTRWVRARVTRIEHRVDVGSGAGVPDAGLLAVNDLGVVAFELSEPIFADPYRVNRATGSFVLVDETSAETVGAGMVRDDR